MTRAATMAVIAPNNTHRKHAASYWLAVGLCASAMLFTALADARGATLTRSLRDLGFSTGLRLSHEQTGDVFLRVPAGATLEGVALETYGSGTAAGLSTGTVQWSVNGIPIDALRIKPGAGRWTLERQASIRAEGVDRTSALTSDARSVNVRYAVDLRRDGQDCQSDGETNALAIAPSSRIRLDMDVTGVDTLAGALDLLPPTTSIVLPAGERLSERAFASALRVALAVKDSGREPRFVAHRPAETLVALSIVSDADAREETRGVRLVKPAAERFDILIDEAADVGAFLRLWNREPQFLADDIAPSVIEPLVDADEASPTSRDFERLPAATAIGRRSEWSLPFEMTGPDGRIPDAATLNLHVAPDWSEKAPVLTVFLNDQIIDARRLNTGAANAVSFGLPMLLLQQDNVLRLVVDRAPQPDRCFAPGEGLYGQLTGGTRLQLGERAASGFAAVAQNLDDGGAFRIRIPDVLLEKPAAGRHLIFLSDVLHGLNADGASRLIVTAGPATDAADIDDDLTVEIADTDGLTVELTREAAQSGTLSFDAGAPFAAATTDGDRLRLTLPTALIRYEATAFGFRRGDRALLGTQGVVWQKGTEDGAAAARRPIRDVIERVRQIVARYGLVFLFGMIGVVLAVLSVREAIVRRSVRKRASQAIE